MGGAHKAGGMSVTLWAHLVDTPLLGWASKWVHITIVSAMKAERGHKALKTEISKHSFRGGAKGRRFFETTGGKKGKGWEGSTQAEGVGGSNPLE